MFLPSSTMPPHAPKKADGKPEDFQALQFINLTNNYCPDSNSKRLVRAHVMKKYRGDQRKKGKSSATQNRPIRELGDKVEVPKGEKVNRVTKLPTPLATRNTWIVEKASPSSLQPCTQLARETGSQGKGVQDDAQEDVSTNETQIIRLPRILGAGRIDPLNSLPIKNSPQTAYLIDHCKSNINLCSSNLITNSISSLPIYRMESQSNTRHVFCKILSILSYGRGSCSCNDDICR